MEGEVGHEKPEWTAASQLKTRDRQTHCGCYLISAICLYPSITTRAAETELGVQRLGYGGACPLMALPRPFSILAVLYSSSSWYGPPGTSTSYKVLLLSKRHEILANDGSSCGLHLR